MQKISSDNLATLPPWDGPAVLLLDLDAFFASVEQLDHPDWRGKPVIVGGDAKRRGVVSTCSYEARAFGVRSAMASAQAARLCPQAIWTPGNFPRYIALSKQVMSIMLDVSSRLQQVSIDEAFLDVSPGRFVKDHPVLLANQIRERVAALGITCSIGLGTTKSVAKIASDLDKPNGLSVVYPGKETKFLAPLPVRIMSGIGQSAEKQLHNFGIQTLGELAAADASILQQVFGKNAQMMRERCLGCELSPVQADDQVKSVSNEMTFKEDLTTLDEIKQAAAMLAIKVARRLRHKGLAGYTVTLKVRYHDLSIRTAQQTLGKAVDDEQEIIPILHQLIPQLWYPGDHLRLVGVAVSAFDQRPQQLSLFDLEGLSDRAETDGQAGSQPASRAASQPGSQTARPAAGQTARPAASQTGSQIDHQTGGATGLANAAKPKTPRRQPSHFLVEATDRVKDRFGEDAVSYGLEMKFRERDTGTIAQKKDDYKDPLLPESLEGT